MASQRNVKTGLTILVLGILMCVASAWCEIQAHLVNGQPVQELGSAGANTPKIYKESTEFYITSSLAVRLFTIGAVLIGVGTLQMQRAQTAERITRLEAELAAFRSHRISAA
jgi:hypothetical protein